KLFHCYAGLAHIGHFANVFVININTHFRPESTDPYSLNLHSESYGFSILPSLAIFKIYTGGISNITSARWAIAVCVSMCNLWCLRGKPSDRFNVIIMSPEKFASIPICRVFV